MCVHTSDRDGSEQRHVLSNEMEEIMSQMSRLIIDKSSHGDIQIIEVSSVLCLVWTLSCSWRVRVVINEFYSYQS